MSAFSQLVDASTEPISVLHVDDEPDLADLTARFLEREDDRFEVTIATGARDGLARLDADAFDCIVSDYDMPGLNGIEFLEAVRERHPDLPFILFTGKGSEEVASDAISAGVTDYLQKESGTDQYAVLANRISNAIDRHQSQLLVERSERRLREIIDAVPHLLHVVAADGTYLLANEALATFHDTTVDAIEGSHVTDVLDAPAAERFLEDLAAVIDSGTPRQMSALAITNGAGEERILEPRLLPCEFTGPDKPAALGIAVDVTEREQREHELERTRERMQLALEHTDSVIFEVDIESGEMVRHGAFEQFFDLQPSEVPTWEDHLENAVHPDDHAQFRRFYERLLDGACEGGTLEYRTHPTHGAIRWIRNTIRVRPDESDTPHQAVGIARDITTDKERKLDLRQNERRYQAVFNDPNILVGLIDTDGTVLDINETAMEYVDSPLEEITGKPFWATPWFDHSETVQQDVREWIDRAAAGEYVEFEADLVRPSGDPYTIEGVFRPVTNDEGEVVSLLISDRDITERKARERELQQYEAYLEGSSDVITVLDPTGTITYQSPAVERVLGYDRTEFVGQNGFDYIHPDDLDEVREQFTALVADPSATVTLECRFKTADGEWCWIEVRGTNRLDHDAINGIVTNNRDITERKVREQALERERDRLDEFAGVVSHDLRNPLTVARGRLELAREERDSEHLDAIETAMDRIDRIASDMLWLAREGRDIGSLRTVVLEDVVDAAWNMVADRAAHAKLHHESDALSTATIEADEDRLNQLLENLFSNAIEHGGEDVTVTVGVKDDGFYVEDDGPGIPEDRRDDVFAAGYSTGETGTGFGLRIVKQVVEAHDWEIRVVAGTDGGARFEITGVEFGAA
jgi:PAS domain S-box-containing protein